MPHERKGTNHPDGANEGLVDGSVSWVQWESTLQLTEFSTTYENDYFSQQELPAVFTKEILWGLAPTP